MSQIIIQEMYRLYNIHTVSLMVCNIDQTSKYKISNLASGESGLKF